MRDLVLAHQEPGRPAFDRLLKRFEDENGRIKEQYFSHSIEAGAILLLSEENRLRVWRHRYRISLSFDSTAAVQSIDDLVRSARAEERRWVSILTGRSQEAVVQAVFTLLVSLLNFADFSRTRAKDGAIVASTASEQVRSGAAELRGIRDFARKLARRATLQYYMSGMPIGVAVVAMLVYLLNIYPYSIGNPGINFEIFSAVVAGAIGSIISVMVRLTNDGKVNVDYDQGRLLTILIGGFRPIIGAVLAAALTILIYGGVVPIAVPDGRDASLFFVGLAFLAGFSERWAQDTIVSSAPKIGVAEMTGAGSPEIGSGAANGSVDRKA